MRVGTVSVTVGLVLVLAACSNPAPVQTVAAVSASEIASIDDGIAWARSLDTGVDATELSTGINAIEDQFSALDGIWFETHNNIDGELMQLNADVLADPGTAGDKVDDLNTIVDEIEVAIDKGDNP